MQHPLSSRVTINATPLAEPRINALSIIFLSFINATPREDKCNTINATPVRWNP